MTDEESVLKPKETPIVEPAPPTTASSIKKTRTHTPEQKKIMADRMRSINAERLAKLKESKQPVVEPPPVIPPPPATPKVEKKKRQIKVIELPESESESDNDILVVRRTKTPKPKYVPSDPIPIPVAPKAPLKLAYKFF